MGAAFERAYARRLPTTARTLLVRMPHRPSIAYQPALDGVRAVAVTAVLLFHGGVPGFEGGYLGVSVFFTLSGYLITSLLLQEHHRTGAIDLPGFYSRRLRRLLPASTLCLAGIALLAAFTGVFDGVANLRTHLLGSLFQVANWVFLVGDGSYQDLLAAPAGPCHRSSTSGRSRSRSSSTGCGHRSWCSCSHVSRGGAVGWSSSVR